MEEIWEDIRPLPDFRYDSAEESSARERYYTWKILNRAGVTRILNLTSYQDYFYAVTGRYGY